MEDSKVPVAENPEEAEKIIESQISEQEPDTIQPKKNIFKKIWHFLWHEESLISYAVFIIVAFVILKFIVFPGLLFATGYSDIAAVVSSSMYHGGDQFEHSFYAWLDFHGYEPEEVEQWPFMKGLNVGDVILVRKVPAEEIQVGDIILFYAPKGQIIHRVIEVKQVGDSYFYTTKGDANVAVMTIETDIPYSEIKGKLVNKIPFFGYPKVALTYVIPKFR